MIESGIGEMKGLTEKKNIKNRFYLQRKGTKIERDREYI